MRLAHWDGLVRSVEPMAMPQWQDQLNRRLSMKKTRYFRLVRFTLLLLTGSLCVGRLTAQAGEAVSAGKFTLTI